MMMMTSRSNHSDFLKELHHHQDLMDRQHAALSYMEKAAKEAQALREENISLKMFNSYLTNQLAFLQKATSQYAAAAVGSSSLGLGSAPSLGPGAGYDLNSMLNAMERMSLVGRRIDEVRQQDCEDNVENPDPAGFVNLDPVEEKENVVPDRISLPKSISVRSNVYLRTAQTGGNSGVKANKVT